MITLASVSAGGITQATYIYDANEQIAIRDSLVSPAGVTHYVHDIYGNVIAETAGGGAAGATGTVREYIWLYETEIAPTSGSHTMVDRPLAVVRAVMLFARCRKTRRHRPRYQREPTAHHPPPEHFQTAKW